MTKRHTAQDRSQELLSATTFCQVPMKHSIFFGSPIICYQLGEGEGNQSFIERDVSTATPLVFNKYE